MELSNELNSRNKEKEMIYPFMVDDIDKGPEEKVYIILYIIDFDDTDMDREMDSMYRNIFSVCIGRTECYNDIKNKLISGVNINVRKSKVMVETKQTNTKTGEEKYYMMPYSDCISVLAFCTNVRHLYPDDEFEIDDYTSSDEDINNATEVDMKIAYTKEQLQLKSLLDAISSNSTFSDMQAIMSNQEGNNI